MLHKFIRQPIQDIILYDFRDVGKLAYSIINILLLLNALYFALKKLVKPAKVKQSCGFSQEEGGLDCVYFIEHGVIVDWQFFEDANKEVIGIVGVAECMIIDYGIFFANVEPVLLVNSTLGASQASLSIIDNIQLRITQEA